MTDNTDARETAARLLASGISTNHLCTRLGVSRAAFCGWLAGARVADETAGKCRTGVLGVYAQLTATKEPVGQSSGSIFIPIGDATPAKPQPKTAKLILGRE